MLTFEGAGEYKTFEPSLSETFIFVLEGELELSLGETVYVANIHFTDTQLIKGLIHVFDNMKPINHYFRIWQNTFGKLEVGGVHVCD
ncbi:hypothetical protein EfmJHP38_09800 [Enterococcus faecium]|nr:hypothetical protein EfmJHP38_09800 [Enterococcus faecium]